MNNTSDLENVTEINKQQFLKIFITAILITICFSGFSQNYNMDNTLVTTCTGNFYDSGGAGGNYGNNESFTKTFTPATAGNMLQFNFIIWDIRSGETLEVFDGPTIADPLIDTYTSGNIPTTVLATNTGDLTVRWISNNSQNRPGWESTIICIPPSPCDDEIAIGDCGAANEQTFTGGGAGVWDLADDCGWGWVCDGEEQIYSFVAPATGTYSLEVTAASGWVDYAWQANTCAETGWTCVDDISVPGTYGSFDWTAGTTYYIILDDENSTAGTHTFYINCPPGPCENEIEIGGCGIGNEQTFTGGGAGMWDLADDCGWGWVCDGEEQIYSFVAPTTGTYSLEVTAASGWVDYAWQANTCAETGWTCVDDISTPGTYGSFNWTAGTTYYIILDDENSTIGTHTFYINCPVIVGTGLGPGGVVNNLTLWFKANQGVFSDAGITSANDGDLVHQWDQISDNVVISPLIQATVSEQPTYFEDRINFNPSLYLASDGSDYMLTNDVSYTDWTDGDKLTAYIVCKAEPSSICLFSWDDPAPNKFTFGTSGAYYDGSNSNAASYGSSVGMPYIKSLKVNASNLEALSNNQLIGTNTVIDFNNAINAPFCLGRIIIAGFPGKGDVAELVIYNESQTAGDVNQVVSYLAVKYGITLGVNGVSQDYISSQGATIWDITANNGYNFNIAGIGRDDDSDLDQRKSKSVNDEAVVTIEHIAAKSVAFTNNETFFVWGSNGLVFNSNGISDFVTINPEIIETRVNRIWKTQSTNDIGEVEIEFDMNINVDGMGFPIVNDLNKLRLLVDTDDNFTTGALSVLPSSVDVGSNTVKFRHDFASGAGHYFSLGTIEETTAPLPVSFLDFDVECLDNKVKLNWSTASELNNDFFTIEKSLDGKNWYEVGQIEGAGNSNSLIKYSYLDYSEINRKGWYYRIKQTDFDGTQSSSEIILTDCSLNDNTSIKIINSSFSEGNIEIQFYRAAGREYVIDILDMIGRKLSTNKIIVSDNYFTYELDKNKFEAGFYNVVITGTNKLVSKQIVIAK